MGVRSIIRVEGAEHAEIYNHWDSPDQLMKCLKDFNKGFTKERGDDPDYKLAQVLRFAIVMAEKYKVDPSLTTGWGIVPYGSDCGQCYTYILKKDGTVKLEK